MERRRSSNLFRFSVTLAGGCPKSNVVVYITFPPWHSTLFVCRRGLWSKSYEVHRELPVQTCTDGLFQGLKLLVTHLIQYCMGVQKSTESLSFDLRSKSCRMRRPTHSKVFDPAVSRIETSQKYIESSIYCFIKFRNN